MWCGWNSLVQPGSTNHHRPAFYPLPLPHRQHHFLKRLDGNKKQQQNPKCQQCILVATTQAPENHGDTLRCNHGCTFRCVLSTPNLVVFFSMGQQSAPRYLGVQDFSTVFGLESVVHVGPLQYVL